MNDDLQIKQLKRALVKASSQQLGSEEEVQKWIAEIASDTFELVTSLLDILSQTTSSENTSDILEVLFLLSKMRPEAKASLLSNTDFFVFLLDYTDRTAIDSFVDPFFTILTLIPQAKDLSTLIEESFIGKLFDALGCDTDDSNKLSVVRLLAALNCVNNQLVYEVFRNHENSSLFINVILHIYNASNNVGEVEDCLLLLIEVISREKNSPFYTSDLETFVDISIKNLEKNTENDLIHISLTCLLKVLQLEIYRESKYKSGELEELMESLIDSEIEQESKVLCKEIMEIVV